MKGKTKDNLFNQKNDVSNKVLNIISLKYLD